MLSLHQKGHRQKRLCLSWNKIKENRKVLFQNAKEADAIRPVKMLVHLQKCYFLPLMV